MFYIYETKGVIFGLNVHDILLIASLEKCHSRIWEKHSGKSLDPESSVKKLIWVSPAINPVIIYTVGFNTCGSPIL